MSDFRGKTIRVGYAWINDQIREDVRFHIDSAGIITRIDSDSSAAADLNLSDHVIIPGFVNSHSHAFHRHLRGRSEIGRSAADTFWKWRDNMYGLVAQVDQQKIYEYCISTFREMLSAGITTVGEFHYVHHSDQKFDLDRAVIRAANDSGIRLVLLETLYERAGFDYPPIHPVQQTFISSYDDFLENLKDLRSEDHGDRVTIGVAAHSTRAVPFDNIRKLYEYAETEKIPFHIHLEEQPKEIIDCQLANQQTPSDMLLSNLQLSPLFTAVHATYTSAQNMTQFSNLGVNVSICPCTEGYLGDGIPKINRDLNISFGTDCNNRICFLEEMRWACFSQQMLNNSRSVASLSAEKLLQCATIKGAQSLGLATKCGTLEVGKYFDASSFSLTTSPTLSLSATSSPNQIIDTLVFSAGNREISHVFVGGKIVGK